VTIMTKTRVLVVDDHEVVRQSLCELVQSSFPEASCLEASNGEEAVELAAAHRPPLVLMDISLPGISGIEATRRVKAVSPASRVVVVSIFDTAAHRADAAAAGACGYVAKIDLGRELVPVIRRHLEAVGQGVSATGPDRINHDRSAANGDSAP
jgi:DNA-binding NarL/FixJ family response regulator